MILTKDLIIQVLVQRQPGRAKFTLDWTVLPSDLLPGSRMEERHSAVCLMQFLSSAVGCKHAEVTEAADLIRQWSFGVFRSSLTLKLWAGPTSAQVGQANCLQPCSINKLMWNELIIWEKIFICFLFSGQCQIKSLILTAEAQDSRLRILRHAWQIKHSNLKQHCIDKHEQTSNLYDPKSCWNKLHNFFSSGY